MSGAEEARPASPRADREGHVGPLPGPVRARVVALTADVLGRIPADGLPASLRRVASFAPTRRTKLAGTRIASVLEGDEDFRVVVAAQARLEMPELCAALDAGEVPAAADPLEVAAVAYLLRPPGWPDLVRTSAGLAETDQAAVAARQAQDQVDRVRRRLDVVTEELRAARQKARDRVTALKAENAELRHKLGDARARAKKAEQARAEAEAAATGTQAASVAATAAAEAEARRLRARVEELERELGALRRSDRSGRDTETLRARLLLDALLDSAQGLRRELALPPVEGTPADQVEAHVAVQGSRRHTGHGSLGPDDPTLLDQLLALPRAHMIVDGYNVTKTAWPALSLEKQRDRLLAGVAPLVARSGTEATVVFDAAESRERPVVNKPRGVKVLFTPEGMIADDLIRELVAVEPSGRTVVVVTSDLEIVRDVTAAGFRVVSAGALVGLLTRG